ncbi:MAG: aldo/keto reductase [Rhizobiales bacterium]|nr:aldo/keto reductase [Hyphomicrobiales bacterium]
MAPIGNIGPIPQIGYGTWKRFGEDAYNCVRWALDAGYRHIDTAEAYGNEADVGRAIAESGIPRNEIFIATKVAPENLGPGQVMPHAKASLEKLGVDHVDLLLVHWPSVNGQYGMKEYLAQFAAVQDAGLATHIGVSNFTRKHIDAARGILGTRSIATNQCEIHVLLQNRAIVDHCKAAGIPMTAYSPLARGAVLDIPELKQIATRHGTSAEIIALAFLMAEGHVIIPTSSNKARIASNLAATDVSLTPEDIALIRGLDKGQRLVSGGWAPVWDS